MRIPPLLALLLLAAAAPLAAQPAPADTVRVGSPSLRVDRLAARTDSLELWMRGRGGRETRVGVLVLQTELPEGFGPPLIERTETLHVDGARVSEDRWMLDRRSLKRRSVRTAGGRGREGLDRLLQRRGAAGGARGRTGREEVNDTMPRPRFLSASMDLLLGALPLSAGRRVCAAVWDDADGAGWATVRVAGLEDLEGAARRCAPGGWRWRGPRASGAYWLDRESHALVRYVGPSTGWCASPDARGGPAPCTPGR